MYNGSDHVGQFTVGFTLTFSCYEWFFDDNWTLVENIKAFFTFRIQLYFFIKFFNKKLTKSILKHQICILRFFLKTPWNVWLRYTCLRNLTPSSTSWTWKHVRFSIYTSVKQIAIFWVIIKSIIWAKLGCYKRHLYWRFDYFWCWNLKIIFN